MVRTGSVGAVQSVCGPSGVIGCTKKGRGPSGVGGYKLGVLN